jgi:hypothetical protein
MLSILLREGDSVDVSSISSASSNSNDNNDDDDLNVSVIDDIQVRIKMQITV